MLCGMILAHQMLHEGIYDLPLDFQLYDSCRAILSIQ